jgi:hypothetical protein
MTVELWDMPPALESLAQLRSAGQSSWLRVLEWLTGDSITTTSTVLAQPITVGVTYRVTDVLHLDASQLTIHRWEKSDNVWTALSTIVDTNQNQATAQTTEIGRFDLQAPLLCPADSQEPDDHYDAAQTVPTDGTPVSRLFDIAEDEDWFRLEAEDGGKYIVRTRNLAAGVDTVVEIYDQDSLMLLALDRDSGGRGASYLMWQAPLDGTYFLRVARAAGSAYGCDAGYELGVKQVYWPSSAAIFGPTTGLLDNGYGFTAATSPITATQPITYVWQAPGQSPVTHVGGLSDVVTFTWRTTGAQVITVTATNVAGAAVGSHSIVIYTPARAAFTASPTFGQVPLTVAFTNLSTGDYTESLWDFGDGSTLLTTGGQTSTQESATHTYTKVGTYSVKLTVSGPGGRDTETKEAHITVVQRVHSIYLPLILR